MVRSLAVPVYLRVFGGSSDSPAQAPKSGVERGRYLVNHVSICGDCHTPMKMGPAGPELDMARMLSGHPDSGRFVERYVVLREELVNQRRDKFFGAYMQKAKQALTINVRDEVLARIAGAGQIIACDPVPAKRELAKVLGATDAVDALADTAYAHYMTLSTEQLPEFQRYSDAAMTIARLPFSPRSMWGLYLCRQQRQAHQDVVEIGQRAGVALPAAHGRGLPITTPRWPGERPVSGTS